MPAPDQRHVLLTGATDGIGKEAAIYLASNGMCKTLILHGRNPDKLANVAKEIQEEVVAKQQQAPPKIHLVVADFSSLESVRSLAKEIIEKYSFVNILVNNAGILTKEYGKTKEGFEQVFGVNTVAPALLTMLLLQPVLLKNPHSGILFTSSMAHLMYGLSSAKVIDGKQVRTGEKLTKVDYENINPQKEEEFEWYRQYSVSKLGNTLFSQQLEKMLSKKNNDSSFVFNASFHPGVLETTLKNNGIEIPGLPAKEGIKTMIHLITMPDEEAKAKSGQYWNDHAEIAEMNPIAKDDEELEKFFEAVCQWAGCVA